MKHLGFDIFRPSGKDAAKSSKDLVPGDFSVFKDDSIRATCLANLTMTHGGGSDSLDAVSEVPARALATDVSGSSLVRVWGRRSRRKPRPEVLDGG